MNKVTIVLSMLVSLSAFATENFKVTDADEGYEKTIELTLKIDGREYLSGTNTVLIRNIRFQASSPYNGDVNEFRLDYGTKTLQNVCSYLGHGYMHTPPKMNQSSIDSILEINNSQGLEKLKYEQIVHGVSELNTFSDIECTVNK